MLFNYTFFSLPFSVLVMLSNYPSKVMMVEGVLAVVVAGDGDSGGSDGDGGREGN